MEYNVGGFMEEYLPGNPLLFGNGKDRVHPRSIDYFTLHAIDKHRPSRHFDRSAGIIGNGYISTCQCIEENTLADIGVPHQGNLFTARTGTIIGRDTGRSLSEIQHVSLSQVLLMKISFNHNGN